MTPDICESCIYNDCVIDICSLELEPEIEEFEDDTFIYICEEYKERNL